MAEYSEVFTSKLDWAMPFQRTGKFPLDRSSMFSSYEDALEYAKQTGADDRKLGGTSYIGQIVVVYGQGIGITNSEGVTTYPEEVAAYIITATGENAALQKLAQTTASGDFGADIAALQSAVASLDTRIKTLEDEPRVVDTNTTYTLTTGDTTEGSIRVTDSDGNTYEVAIKGYDALKALATGRSQAYVYANKYDDAYVTDIANPSKYKKGDLIYFTDTGIPDEWVTGKLTEANNGSWYTFAPLEVEHPDLTQYLTKGDAQSTYATKTELATKANSSTVTELNSKVDTFIDSTYVADQQSISQQINKVAEDLSKIDVTSQITSEINKLDTEGVGNANGNFYIKYIKQTDGKIEASAEAMPDVSGIAQSAANTAASGALSDAKAYTNERIGDLGNDELVTNVTEYIAQREDYLSGEIVGVSGRVQVIENQNLNTRLGTVEGQASQNATDIGKHATRLSAVESVASDAQTRVSALEGTVSDHATAISNLQTAVAGRVKTIQVGGVAQTMTEDGTVNISSISTDLLVNGSNTLVLDCLNASLTSKS